MTRTHLLALVATATIALAGCASSHAETMSGDGPSMPAAMTPGMVMPDGSTMGAGAPASAGPSAAGKMICAAETRSNVAKVLALKTAPPATSHWADSTYVCRYRLPMGQFVLSVHDSVDAASAKAYIESARAGLHDAAPVAGLTDTAYSTAAGVVLLLKDSDTLRVDASALPARFGAQHEKRADFAYEIASDILGCWTGDDS